MAALQGLTADGVERMLQFNASEENGAAIGGAMQQCFLTCVVWNALYVAGLVRGKPIGQWHRAIINPPSGKMPEAVHAITHTWPTKVD